MELKTYNKYISLGFQMLELGANKKPKYKRIVNNKCNKKSHSYKNNAIYGVIPPKSIMIIDVDIKNGGVGLDSLSKLEDDLGYALTPTVQTGSGGLHIYCKFDKAIKTIQKQYPNIDFITHKNNTDLCTPFCVAGDQVIQNDNKDYVYTILNSGNIFFNDVIGIDKLLTPDVSIVTNNDSDFGLGDIYDKKTASELNEMLKWIDSSDYINWMAYCAMIKRELDDKDEAFDVFHNWSKKSDNYDGIQSCMKKFNEVDNYQGDVRTVGTLVYDSLENKSLQLLCELDGATTIKQLDKIINDDKWLNVPRLSNDIINNDIAKKYKDVYDKYTNDKPINYRSSKSVVKVLAGKLVNDIELDDEEESVDLNEEALNELSNIVKVDSFSRLSFFNITNNARYDLDSADRLLSKPLRLISSNLALKKPMSVQTAFKKRLISHASNHEYNPTINDRLFTNDLGVTILNTYDSRTLPVSTPITAEGRKLINIFIKHLQLLMGKDEAEIFIDWLAYAIQNIGKKILWTPLIQSVEGMGKSVIGNLLINHIFGSTNAGVVDSIVIADKTNAWASNKVLRILEEIKLSGHNRYEVLNQLKPIITNDTITRKEKYEISSEVKNTCNFIAFTNYKDALPLDANDRRWWLVFSPIRSLSKLEEITKINKFEYFEPLYKLADKNSTYGSEFKTFLLNRDVSEFSPNFAPYSKHKQELQDIEREKLPNLDEVQDLIDYVYDNPEPDVIDIRLLREANQYGTNDDGNRILLKIIEPRFIKDVLKKIDYKLLAKKDIPKEVNLKQGGRSPIYYKNIPKAEAIKLIMNPKNIFSEVSIIDDFTTSSDVDFLS